MKSIISAGVWGTICLLFTAGWLAVAASAALAQGTVAPARVKTVQYEEPAMPAYRGSLEITLQSTEYSPVPPAEMVLSDPYGETEGYDPRYAATYQEIGGAVYKREVSRTYPEMENIVLNVRNAVSGTYSLRVIGVETGNYILFIKGYDQDRNHADVQFTGRMEPGVIHHYLIEYSNRGGARLNVRRTRITY